MSDSLAIAATTACLADLLAGPLAALVPGSRVTTRRSGAPDLSTGDSFLNLALFAAERAAMPRDAPRRGTGLQPLSLRLTYFISACGDEATLEPQRLLGAALGALHAQPVLTPALIAAVIARAPWLAGCELAAVGEPIRLTAVALGAERIAGLAAALGTPGVLGVVYEAFPVSLGPS